MNQYALKRQQLARAMILAVMLTGGAGCNPQTKQKASQKSPAGTTDTTANTASPNGALSPTNTSGGSNTCLGIVDGQPTGAYTATYLIVAVDHSSRQPMVSCTGSFISDNTMITAAHCIPSAGASDLLLLSNQQSVAKSQTTLQGAIAALAVFYDTSVGPGPDGMTNAESLPYDKDIAIVVFPDKTAAATLQLAKTTRPAGTNVTLVGYGVGDADGDNSQTTAVTKNFGSNTIAAPDQRFPFQGLYQIHAWAHPGEAAGHGSQTVSAAPGDSGGPLLDGNIMIGVVKYGYTTTQIPGLTAMIGTDSVGFWVDVTNDTVKSVIAKAVAGGARVQYEGAPTTVSGQSQNGTQNTACVGPKP